MSRPRRLLIPPLAERMSEGRPVISREQALDLSRKVRDMSTAGSITVTIGHTVKSITQLASDRVRNTDDGDTLEISIRTEFGDSNGLAFLQTNQLDEPALRDLVNRADSISGKMIGWTERVRPRTWDEQDIYPAVKLWRTSTVDALHTAREIVPKIIDTVRQQRLRASGFVGVMAHSEAVLTDEGIRAFSEETDCEVNVTARPADGTSRGWSGTSARDWYSIDPVKVATEAADLAERSSHPQALEPGRRIAILSPTAVVQLMRFFALQFDGISSDNGGTGFSKVPGQYSGSRFHENLFDPRIKITTDPADPDGGFRPWFGKGYVSNPTTWVEERMLKYLAYGIESLSHGKPYAEMPYGFRMHGGDTTLAEMIAQCEEGIYVNRFSDVELVDVHTCMLTGVTSDGCFLVKHGKIDRPLKNFRFLTSPFFVLNNVIAIGPTQRAAFGYSPWTNREKSGSHMPWNSDFFDWPRRPMIVPPLMVRDFNFSALVDAL